MSAPTAVVAGIEVSTGLGIGGIWQPAGTGTTFSMEDPAAGEVLAEVANAGPVDAAEALNSAAAAQAGWASTRPRERGTIHLRAFEAVTAHAEDFARVMTLEMGKPQAEARGEVAHGAEFLHWFSEEAVRINGRYAVSPDDKTRLLVQKRPTGPCLLITPWNSPLAMVTPKIGLAAAAGCTLVPKPAALTPLTSQLLAAMFEESGLPPGVLNVVPTTDPGGTVEPLLSDHSLRKLSFTGSTPVGRPLLQVACGTVVRTSMELGGNAPLLVIEDDALEKELEGMMLAKLRNRGEACTAANRFQVQEPVGAVFSARLAERMGKLRIGPRVNGSDIGPLIDDRAVVKIDGLVQGAVDAGAKILIGGSPQGGAGHFCPPTVLTGVPSTAQISNEEIFGPVAASTPFDTEAVAVALADATGYGLVAYAHTAALHRALRLGESLKAWMLGINVGIISTPAAPFGGVKQSDLGREGGVEGLEEYLETRHPALPDPSDR